MRSNNNEICFIIFIICVTVKTTRIFSVGQLVNDTLYNTDGEVVMVVVVHLGGEGHFGNLTAPRRVQITPKTSTNITRYLYSRGPVRQVCLLLTNQLAGFPAPIKFRFAYFCHAFPDIKLWRVG